MRQNIYIFIHSHARTQVYILKLFLSAKRSLNNKDWLTIRIARSCLLDHLQSSPEVSPIAVLNRLEKLVHRSATHGWDVILPMPFPGIVPQMHHSTSPTHVKLRKFPSGPNFGDDYIVFVNEQNPSRSFIIKLYSGNRASQ